MSAAETAIGNKVLALTGNAQQTYSVSILPNQSYLGSLSAAMSGSAALRDAGLVGDTTGSFATLTGTEVASDPDC